MSGNDFSEPLPWQRSHLGYEGRFVEDVEVAIPDGKTVRVSQTANPLQKGKKQVAKAKAKNKANKTRSSGADPDALDDDPAATGTTVWDCGILLPTYLNSCVDDTAHNPFAGLVTQLPFDKCIELGCGTGVASICLAAYGKLAKSYTLTDIPVCVSHIQGNVDKNRDLWDAAAVNVQVAPLSWGNEGDVHALPVRPPFDLIVGTDVIYYDEEVDQIKTLLEAITHLSSSSTLVFLALDKQHAPNSVDLFIETVRAGGLWSNVVDMSARVPRDMITETAVVLRLSGFTVKNKMLRK
uniref:Calmodulin-lysine N-methyltransferase n=1 Tax=Pyramimonas obovata TaxID=1411642 RepID=A0A7S0RV83_9CHLO|mmetsp:Transcript_7700/g.15682  ORF Transcript_7700/g.15682 Transcript_7700/m.15682 type:complete len:295 (+) Transcript_7700:265-1149(+)|eukprot:CAMPEP_0118924310 /NCGR_PEP_ID=MMETSP1169-20130426/2503_1 /TAXON_ID=36882 /ORGANISM="Pyramimonas obovata, Strain CCMP722" /LENGTH=294 /DNA_ID=CAMNT_0006865407 /DNA_START=265 /DNA_END=1149 /DNA_ORIENTATION=+